MESTPEGIDPEAVQKALEGLPGVQEVHDLHIWSASHHKIVLSVHLIADPSNGCFRRGPSALRGPVWDRHMTIQVEDPKIFEPKYCYDCENKL